MLQSKRKKGYIIAAIINGREIDKTKEAKLFKIIEDQGVLNLIFYNGAFQIINLHKELSSKEEELEKEYLAKTS